MKKFILTATALLPLLLSAKEPEPNTLTVISYNIRMGEANDGTNSWAYRYPASAMMITDQKPDIFGLQEAYRYQSEYMAEYCKGYKGVGVGREDGKKKGEYMSIFYNTKTISLLKWGTFWLSETPDEPSLGWDAACRRTATWAVMKHKASGRKFFYVNTHLDHVGIEARRRGLELIVSRIASLNKEGLPVVLTGDFNMTPDAPELAALGDLKSAREVAVKTDKGGTYHDWGKLGDGEPIDYICAAGFSTCLLFEVVRTPYYDRKFISDHYPVKAIYVL